MKKLALVAAVGLLLVGCGSSTHSTRRSSHVPQVFPLGWSALPHGARFFSPTRLGIVTWGSSSCPSVPDRLTVVNRSSIRIHLVTGSWRRVVGRRMGLLTHPPAGGVCTADWGSMRLAVAIDPNRIDVHRPLTVNLYYRDDTKPTTFTAPAL